MFGICNLSVVPVRKEPTHKSEQVTQLLFGEVYGVLGETPDGSWLHIKLCADDYEGYITSLQHFHITEAYFQHYVHHSHTLCMDDVAWVRGKETHSLITFGSTLPFLKNREAQMGSQVFIFEGELYEKPNTTDKEFIKFVMLRFLDVPYLWGGRSMFGIDCSGFTQMVYKILGYQLYRDAYQQATQGKVLDTIAHTTTGDLVFFENDEKKITHVGLILEDNKIIHAHGRVRIDIVDEKGIFNLLSKKYSHKFSTIKRIL